MKQAYGDEKKKEYNRTEFKLDEGKAEAELVKLKQSLSPKIPININRHDTNRKESTDYDEASIIGLKGGKYSTITVVNYESSPQPSR